MEKPSNDLQAALDESEVRYRQLVESASDGIYRISTQGYFLYANPVANRVLGGAGNPSIVGRHYLEFVRQDFHDQMQHFYYRQVKDGTPVTYYEFPALSADGREVWIGQRVHLELSAQGVVRGLHAIARDITDRKRLEDELRQSDKMRVVSQLAGGIAHDFNSILTAIRGFAELLEQSLGPTDPRSQDARQIWKAADKAAQLTSQLLTFSRRELFRPKLLDLNAVILDVVPMLRQIAGPQVTLETVLSPDLHQIRADAGHLEQVLANLVMNAQEAMLDGGVCTIRTENVYIGAGGKPDTSLYPGPYVRLSVSDTGIGMSEQTKARIFEPFFSTKEPGTGAGLGLSTTFGIVNQAGGRILVESTRGSGTCFEIYLPQAHTIPSYEGLSRTTVMAPTGRVVLVADDEEGVRAVIARVLELHGYEVISATNGVDALTKAKEHSGPIHLLLTDLVMPQMGGFELAEAFVTEKPSARVLFMSGYVDKEGLDLRLGTDVRLLHKPFDTATMLSEVERVLS